MVNTGFEAKSKIQFHPDAVALLVETYGEDAGSYMTAALETFRTGVPRIIEDLHTQPVSNEVQAMIDSAPAGKERGLIRTLIQGVKGLFGGNRQE